MKRYFLLWMLLSSPGAILASDEGRLLRFPATNGETVVFSYAGDLYSAPLAGGQAKRLTAHPGYEMFPRFSPDGKTIAFTGQYDGNTEVFTIPGEGGEPLRLTYTATLSRDDIGDRMGPNNIVLTWTPDGSRVVYRSRQRTGGSFTGNLFTVDKTGGLSDIVPLPEGGFCSYAPDGRSLAYNRVMREFRTWKYYKGGMADDIWIYDFDTRKTVNISENAAQDIIPMWIGDKIYYLSDRDRIMNLFSYDTKTKQTKKETDFKTYDIKFPSSHGTLIVFENGGYLYKFDTATGKAEKIDIVLASDNAYARSEIKDGRNYITAISASPAGERLAVTARGEVFNVPAANGVTKNITRTPGAHERRAKWSYDGASIAYISDITGETELYLQPAEGGEPVRLTSANDTYITDFLWAPDSKSILLLDRKNRMTLLDVKTKKKTLLLEDPNGQPGGVNFSSDGKWLTYSRPDSNDMSVIYAYDLAAKKEYRLTDKWYSSYSPRFSNDGKYIIFTSARDFNPTYGSTEWNHVYNNMNGIYLLLLSKDTPSPFLEKDDVVGKQERPEADSSGIRIDEEGLSDRIVRLPLRPSYYSGFFGVDGRIYYHQGGSVRMYDLKNKSDNLIAEGAYMDIAPGGKKAVFRRGGDVYVTDLPAGTVNLNKPVNLSDMKITTDYPQEWAQIFDEAWRHMRDGFYLENMHGVDWKAVRKKYEVLLPYVKHRLDLNYVIGEMIGELNCGHAYINPGETVRAERENLGLLGAEIARDKSGYFVITKILKGASYSPALRSPLTENGLDVKEGEYIIAIDGIDASETKDLYSLLVGKAGVPTEITLNGAPSKNGARKVVIRPIASEAELYHYGWVQDNIRKVEEASGGKIGYVYIPDMGVDGLNEFARHFYPQLDKEGLIIDDRANGGGNVSPMILERLSREPYRVTMSRNSARTHLIPDGTLYGPKVCLINKYSASDGDLFPWGFRALGLGKLIGTRTWGGIVGISGSLPFIDGTDMRVPFFTSYSFKDGQWIIENHGVDPDIVVDNDPAREWDGEDQQLDAAIKEVMGQLKDRKPVPPVPAPRDFSK